MQSPEEPEVSREAPITDRLAQLQALTDSTLAQLDVDELLVELLARVREILDVDTAAVLLLDERRAVSRTRSAKECGFRSEPASPGGSP
jgi:transcriptional regulator with GAF, ATPase, and Fis domain